MLRAVQEDASKALDSAFHDVNFANLNIETRSEQISMYYFEYQLNAKENILSQGPLSGIDLPVNSAFLARGCMISKPLH